MSAEKRLAAWNAGARGGLNTASSGSEDAAYAPSAQSQQGSESACGSGSLLLTHSLSLVPPAFVVGTRLFALSLDTPRKNEPRRSPHSLEKHMRASLYAMAAGAALFAAAPDSAMAGSPQPNAVVGRAAHDSANGDEPIVLLAQARPQRAAPPPVVDPTPADFGTAEGTARIAGTAGFLDMVDIKLGTREKDAVAALKRYNPALTLTPLRLMTYTVMPNVVMTPVVVAETKPAPDGSFERFSLELTYSPNEAFVWGISREFSIAKSQAPTFENTLAGFRTKYGPETFALTNEQLVWVFDAQGKLVPGAKGRDIFYKCTNQWQSGVGGVSAGGNRPTGDNQLSNSWYDQQLRGGFYHAQQGNDYANGVCHSHALVHLGLQRLGAMGAGEPTNLIRGFVVRVSNRQLEASGVQASHKQIAAAAGALQKERSGEAAKRTGPKL
jgi:hypothetical protein